jgi:ubiquinone/menaquinone biosynthesis C-methylase UbiE
MTDYILQTGKEGEERLEVLNDLFGAASREFLVALGLRKGARVLDVGCGTGTLTTWIAELVGPSGHVTGTDADARQIDLARRRAQAAAHTNVDFSEGRLGIDALPAGVFDIVHCRFVLMHLKDVDSALVAMCRSVRGGGILACEEASAASVFTSPPCEPITRMNDLYRVMSQAHGIDSDLGDRLFGLMACYGTGLVSARFVQPMVSITTAKRFLELAANEVRPALLASCLLSEQDAAELVDSLRAVPEDPAAYYAPGRAAQVAVTIGRS